MARASALCGATVLICLGCSPTGPSLGAVEGSAKGDAVTVDNPIDEELRSAHLRRKLCDRVLTDQSGHAGALDPESAAAKLALAVANRLPLEELDAILDVRAARNIAAWREENGDFTQTSQLLALDYVSPRALSRLSSQSELVDACVARGSFQVTRRETSNKVFLSQADGSMEPFIFEMDVAFQLTTTAEALEYRATFVHEIEPTTRELHWVGQFERDATLTDPAALLRAIAQACGDQNGTRCAGAFAAQRVTAPLRAAGACGDMPEGLARAIEAYQEWYYSEGGAYPPGSDEFDNYALTYELKHDEWAPITREGEIIGYLAVLTHVRYDPGSGVNVYLSPDFERVSETEFR